MEYGKGKKQAWSFGYANEKLDLDKITTYKKGKGVIVMVWGAIGGEHTRSELIVMERDEQSARGGFTGHSYRNTLQQGLLPIYEGEVFVQDNAPIHTAALTMEWFTNNGVFCLTGWPPYSPDLNPIEHIWPRLKEAIYELRPDFDTITGASNQQAALEEVLPLAWNAIRVEVIEACVKSMPSRVAAVIAAQGWQTKY